MKLLKETLQNLKQFVPHPENLVYTTGVFGGNPSLEKNIGTEIRKEIWYNKISVHIAIK